MEYHGSHWWLVLATFVCFLIAGALPILFQLFGIQRPAINSLAWACLGVACYVAAQLWGQ